MFGISKKLNDKNFLYVGDYVLSIEDGMYLVPASNDSASRRIGITHENPEIFIEIKI